MDSSLRIVSVLLFVITSAAEEGEVNHSRELKRLTSAFWDWRLSTSPEYATKFGIKLYEDRLEQYTEDAMQQQVEKAKRFLTLSKKINPRMLEEEQEVNSLQILQDLLTSFIDGYTYRKHGAYIALGTFENPVKEMKSLIKQSNFATVGDYEKLLERYQAFAISLDQKKSLLAIAIKSNISKSRDSMDYAISDIASIPTEAENTLFYAPFEQSDIDLKNELQSRAKTIIYNDVLPALRRYAQYLEQEYKPHALDEAGVWQLPAGGEYYRACLRWHLSLDLTPQQIYDMGISEVERINGNIKQIMDEWKFKGNVRDYISHLKTFPDNMFDNEEELMQTYRNTIREVKTRLGRVIGKIPKTEMSIERMEYRGATGRYIEPALDGTRGGIFYANVFDPHTKPRFSVMSLALHEAEPGHHTQAAYAIEEDIPNFRRAIEYRKYYAIPFNWPFYTAYVEGWALYAESLGEEMGLYNDSKSLLGRYTSEIFRACRLVVDTGIHEFRWTKAEAKDYLMQYTDLSESQVEVEIKRYISYPGQATAYKIGELTIKRLRKEAEAKLGSDFDLRHFHKIILELGPAPLSTVEKAVYNWMTTHAAAIRSAASAITSRKLICAASILLFLIRLFIR